MMRQPPMASVNRPMCPRLKKLNHISKLITIHNAKKLELGEPISPRQLVDAILSARFIEEFNSDSKSNEGNKSRKTRSYNATPRDLRNSYDSSPKGITPRPWVENRKVDSESPSSLVMSSGRVSSLSNSSVSIGCRAPNGDCKLRTSYQDDNWLSWSEGDAETLPSPGGNLNVVKRLANPIDKLQEIQQELIQAEEFLQFEDECHLAASENERAYLNWLSKKSNVRKLNMKGKEEKVRLNKAVSLILQEVAENKYVAPAVPSYDEWRKQKTDEIRAAKQKEERKRAEEAAVKAKRTALNEEAFAKWHRESRDKPKPLPVISATNLPTVRSGPSLSWNPVPWDDAWSEQRDASPVRTRSEPDTSKPCIRAMLDDCKSRAVSRRPSATDSRPAVAASENDGWSTKARPPVENRAVREPGTGNRAVREPGTGNRAVREPGTGNRAVKSEAGNRAARSAAGGRERAVSDTKVEKKSAAAAPRRTRGFSWR